MSLDTSRVPDPSRGLFLTDGGLETTLVFHEGWDLPEFASFVLMDDEDGRRYLRDYYRRYFDIARRHSTGFVLEPPTWRGNPDWAQKIGYSSSDLDRINRASVDLMHELRAEFETASDPIAISGCIGPRGDGYVADALMSAEEAADYHGVQIASFKATSVDMVSAFTMTNVNESVGIVNATRRAGLPSVISFTVETDG